MNRLKEKVAIITGAASGLGRDMSLLFAAEGSKVVAADTDQEALEKLERDVISAGGKITTVNANITKQEDIDRMFDITVKTYNTLDILINNSITADETDIAEEIRNEILEKVFAINVIASVKTTRKAVNIMIKKGSGVIINLPCSAPVPEGKAASVYNASKHAVLGLTRNTGYVYSKKGIRCNAIASGDIPKNINKGIEFAKMSDLINDHAIPVAKNNIMTEEPHDIAKVALFLACDDSAFVNGVILIADKGWSA